MHELPIAQHTLERVLAHAREAGGGQVTAINLVIGQLSGVVETSFRFYWDLIAEGTEAAGARIQMAWVDVALGCRGCGGAFPPDGRDYRCPACGGRQVEIVRGRECFLESIEVEPAPAATGQERPPRSASP